MGKEKIMRISCPECEKGMATRQKTLFMHRIGNEIFVIPEIEHLVCDKCGYEFMPEDVWEHILEVFRDIKGTERGVHLSGKIRTGKFRIEGQIIWRECVVYGIHVEGG